jgi:hypothetical protein
MTKEAKKRAVKATAKVLVAESGKKFLDEKGFDMKWLDKLAEQYKFDQFDYVAKFCAFRCYKEGKHVEWIDVNALALLNGKRKLTEILNKHYPVDKSRAIIEFPWR